MSAFRINSRVKKTASFLLGAGLLVWLAVSSGIGSILADLSRVGPGLIIILALEFVDRCVQHTRVVVSRFRLPNAPGTTAGCFGCGVPAAR